MQTLVRPIDRPHRLRPLSLSLSTLFLALALGCTSSDDGGTTNPPAGGGDNPVTTLDRLNQLGLTRFAALAEASSFGPMVDTEIPMTVFAPTNAAVLALGGWPLGASDFSAPGAADEIVGRHLAGGEFDEAVLRTFGSLSTLGGATLVVDVDPRDGALGLDAARVVSIDQSVAHATIYVIDAVATPPLDPLDVLGLRGLTTMRAAIEAAGLAAEVQSGDYTIIAPTQSAFAALGQAALGELFDPTQQAALAERMRFHLVPGVARVSDLTVTESRSTAGGALAFFGEASGGAVTVNGTEIGASNAPTTRGIVHELDGVLAAPLTFEEILIAEDLTAFESLLFAASLGPEFAAQSPLTAFVPSNDAFANLPQATLDMLVDPANVALLRMTVRHHGATVLRPLNELTPGTSLPTMAGDTLELTADGAGGVLLDGTARILRGDLYFDKGLLHVIDDVLVQ